MRNPLKWIAGLFRHEDETIPSPHSPQWAGLPVAPPPTQDQLEKWQLNHDFLQSVHANLAADEPVTSDDDDYDPSQHDDPLIYDEPTVFSNEELKDLGY